MPRVVPHLCPTQIFLSLACALPICLVPRSKKHQPGLCSLSYTSPGLRSGHFSGTIELEGYFWFVDPAAHVLGNL